VSTPHITAPSLEDVQRAASFQGLLLADLEHEVRATFQGVTKARWSKPVDITEIIDWLDAVERDALTGADKLTDNDQ